MSFLRKLFGTKDEGTLLTGTTEEVLNTLSDSRDAAIREAAAFTLGQRKVAGAVEPLIAALKQDSDKNVRIAAALALGKLKDLRAVEPLIEVFGMEEIRRNAAEMTRRMLAGEYVNLASDHLRQQLTGEAEPLVHRAAAIALGQLGDKRAIESLQFVAGATSRDDVKKAATDALKRLGAKPK